MLLYFVGQFALGSIDIRLFLLRKSLCHLKWILSITLQNKNNIPLNSIDFHSWSLLKTVKKNNYTTNGRCRGVQHLANKNGVDRWFLGYKKVVSGVSALWCDGASRGFLVVHLMYSIYRQILMYFCWPCLSLCCTDSCNRFSQSLVTINFHSLRKSISLETCLSCVSAVAFILIALDRARLEENANLLIYISSVFNTQT